MNSPSPGKSFLAKIWSEKTAIVNSKSSSTIEPLRFDTGLDLLGEITGCNLEAEGPRFEGSDVTRIYDDILLGAWFLEGLRFWAGSTVAVLTTGIPFDEFADKGLMITSLPLKVNAESRECNSVSGLTVLALTTMGKSTKKSSWT